ncbi:MAG: tetratricopeptide repeat protein, partial [Pseudomonadota bacterium]
MRATQDRNAPVRPSTRSLALPAAAIVAGVAVSAVFWSGAPAAASESAAAGTTKIEGKTLFGSYLAGRIASRQRDTDAAAQYYRDALRRDPDNVEIAKKALTAELARANWVRASVIAPQIVAKEEGHRAARLYLGLEAFKDGRQSVSRDHFAKAASGPIGELAAALATAWTRAQENDAAKAYAALDTLKKAKWAQYYRLYHGALIADLLGDRDRARKTFAELFESDQRTLRLVLAYARHAGAAGDFRLAKEILATHLKAVSNPHPLARALLSDVGKTAEVRRLVTSAEHGMAEVFYSLGEALTSEGGIDIGATYIQFALYNRPAFPMALITLGSVYEATRRYDEAITTYDRIPDDSPLYFNGEVRRAINLNLLKRRDEAVEALQQLVKRFDTDDPLPAEIDPSDRNRAIQQQLAALDLYSDAAVDGVMGPSSRAAIREFQSKFGLNVDGIAGPATRAALELATKSTDDLLRGERALRVLLTLGTVLRGHEKYEEAVNVYSRAIDLIENPTRRHWRYFYSRGVSHERLKDWPKAEADLERALALNPDEPLILNYLGYSWVDQNLYLEKALAMIKKAVKIKPDDGYFVDSLGWAYYRQGDYPEAVKYLER